VGQVLHCAHEPLWHVSHAGQSAFEAHFEPQYPVVVPGRKLQTCDEEQSLALVQDVEPEGPPPPSTATPLEEPESGPMPDEDAPDDAEEPEPHGAPGGWQKHMPPAKQQNERGGGHKIPPDELAEPPMPLLLVTPLLPPTPLVDHPTPLVEPPTPLLATPLVEPPTPLLPPTPLVDPPTPLLAEPTPLLPTPLVEPWPLLDA
jgi:fibronectin-binding protein A